MIKVILNNGVGRITSKYGAIDSVHKTPHKGVDFAVPEGTELYAPFQGIVEKVVDFGDKSLGKAVYVKIGEGKSYVMGHLSKPLVEQGQEVKIGDVIGLSGNTGHSTGPHLHYGVIENGKAVDPGEITFDSFTKPEYVLVGDSTTKKVTIPESLLQRDPTEDVGGEIDNWIHGKVEAGISSITDTIAKSLNEALQDIIASFLHTTPLVLTVAGMCCFIVTVAYGKGKPYAYGLACWGLAAVVRVMSHEFGS